jgi:hypothetical protein
MLQMHAAKALLLWGDWLEVGQDAQSAPVIDASTVEYVFATHEMQVAGPVIILYLPRTHAAQYSPLLPVYPALHWQSASTSLPVVWVQLFTSGQFWHVFAIFAAIAAENLPKPQSVHAADPVASLYWPIKHAAQG